jgi:integrase
VKSRTGYVYQDKKTKSGYARICYTQTNGKRTSVKRRVENKTQGQKVLKELTQTFENGGRKAFDLEKLSIKDLCDYYAEHYLMPAQYVEGRKVAGLRSFKVVAGYISVIKDFFGKRLLRSITHDDLRTFRVKRLQIPTWQGKPRTIATVNREMAYLRRLLTIAEREGWISRNVFKSGDSLINISDEKKRERILTREEEARLLSACEGKREHLRAIIICALDTGMRRGEVLKLRWRDVDLETRTITIQAFNTKTMKERQVRTTARLYRELEQLWEASSKHRDALVFGIRDTFKTAFYSAIKAAGLAGLRYHDLRHCAASRLVQGQMPLQLVGRILGHTQPSTTYRYINANTETAAQAATILDAFQTEARKPLEASETVN